MKLAARRKCLNNSQLTRSSSFSNNTSTISNSISCLIIFTAINPSHPQFNPENEEQGKNPFKLDSKAPKIPVKEYAYNENRYKMLTKSNPEAAGYLMNLAQEEVEKKWKQYEHLASLDFSKKEE